MDQSLNRLGGAVIALAVAISASQAGAQALDKIRIAKSVATSFAFATLDVGNHAGIWKKNGIELEIRSFRGASQTHQALTANTVEVALSSGPAMAFAAKGVPVKGIAAFAGPPKNLSLVMSKQSGVTTLDGVKGKRIGVTSAGSLTNWLVLETARRKGWGVKGITTVKLGGMRSRLAAIKRGDIDGHVQTTVNGFQQEADGSGKMVLKFGDLIQDFIVHVIFARNDMIANRPDVLRRFLIGWWQSVDYMKNNKQTTLEIVGKVMRRKPEIVAMAYDDVMAMMTKDGTFDLKALKVISRSFVELGTLEKEPDMSKLYTNQFLPVKY